MFSKKSLKSAIFARNSASVARNVVFSSSPGLSKQVFLSVLVDPCYRALFDTEQSASAEVFYDLIVQLSRGDEELHIIDLADEELLSVEVELRQHVVEEQYRRLVQHLPCDADLGELQGKRDRPLLSLLRPQKSLPPRQQQAELPSPDAASDPAPPSG